MTEIICYVMFWHVYSTVETRSSKSCKKQLYNVKSVLMNGYDNDIYLVVMQINRKLGYTETFHNTKIVLYYAMEVIIRSMSMSVSITIYI